MRVRSLLLIILLLAFSYFTPSCIDKDTPEKMPVPTPTIAPTTPAPSPTPSINLSSIITRLEEVRGLKLLYDIPHHWISPDELIKRYNATVVVGDDPDDVLLKALFMVEEGVDPDEVEAEYRSDTVMAYYDIEKKEMVTVRGYEDELEKIYVHEYLHALQDQHFNLTRVLNQSTFDRHMAAKALVEGDALFTYDLYQGKSPSGLTIGISKIYNDLTRRTLEEFRMFPQTKGKYFVTRLYLDGGKSWDLVNEAYHNLPATTEMVIHPDKYFKGEEAVSMSAPEIPLDGWDMTISDTMGEFFIRTMLADHIPSNNASRAASGWGGDRLVLFQNESDYLFVFNISWDTRRDAEEFLDGYRVLMETLDGRTINNGDNFTEWMVDGEWILLVDENDTLNRTVLAGSSNPHIIELCMGEL